MNHSKGFERSPQNISPDVPIGSLVNAPTAEGTAILDSEEKVKEELHNHFKPSFMSNTTSEDTMVASQHAPHQAETSEIEVELFVGEKESLAELEMDFRGNEKILQKVRALNGTCSFFRRVKKDGCCFYRAFLFGLFEHMTRYKWKLPAFISNIQDLKKKICDAGYTMSTVDDFHNEFAECLESLLAEDAATATVEAIFKSYTSANYTVVFARLLTATYMKLNREQFEPFLVNYADIEAYCRSEVDPMWVEAEQLQVIALTTILNTPIAIYCLDNSPTLYPMKQVFPDPSSIPVVSLLYRPGHYDLIYTQDS